MRRNAFTTLFFAGIVMVFVTVCVNADETTQPNKWDKAGTEISEAAGAVNDATVDSSKKAWEGTKKTSGEAWDKTKDVSSETWDKTKDVSSETWDKTKDVSSETWDKTKHATKEEWEKAKSKVHDASAPASD